jgi:hypothetical protein
MQPLPCQYRAVRPVLGLFVGLAVSLSAAPATRSHAQQPEASAPPAPCEVPAVWSAGAVLGTSGEVARLAELAGFALPRQRLHTRSGVDALVAACAPPTPAFRALLRRVEAGDGATISLVPPTVVGYHNSAYARNVEQTGAVWAGRGASASVSAGAAFRWGPLSGAVVPEFVYQQNLDFDTRDNAIPGFSPFSHTSYAWFIDLPQRHGADPFWSVEPGRSHLRLDLFGAGVGLSAENRRIGPMVRNPLLMGYTPPGVLHAFVGTSRPRSIWIGDLDVHASWARLHESGAWDYDPDNDSWLYGTLVLSFAPRGIPGLVLGASRVHHTPIPPEGLNFGHYMDAIFDLPLSQYAGNAPGNGLASIFARWAFPDAGFEAFGEWGRDDYSWDWSHLLKEPDHTRAYAVGMQQLVQRGSHGIRLHGEIAHLTAGGPLRSGSGAPPFYTHGEVRQGHTHRGQPLGVAFGPGADTQHIGADLLHEFGMTGFYLERVRYNADGYFGSWARHYGPNGHDVEITGALRHSGNAGPFNVHALLTVSRRENRDFVGLDGSNWDFLVERNVGLRLGASWWPPHLRSTTPLQLLR